MSINIGSTIVIGDDGKIDWGRLKNIPSNVVNATAGAVTGILGANCGSGTSVTISKSGSTYTVKLNNTNCNCNCDCRC